MFTFLQSCISKKDIVYFQDDESKIENNKSKVPDLVFKPGDMLEIIITATNSKVVQQYNLKSSESASNTLSYIINNKGQINFPILGEIQIGGLRKTEAVTLLKEQLSKSVINPGIHIRILNFSITILGDVNSPGNYQVPNERINIIEAIGLAGDLTFTGKRNRIVVKREESNGSKYYQLDIRSKNMHTSPAYYLQQNDVVYVEPNKAKSQAAATNPNTSLYFTIVSFVIAIGTLIAR